MKRSEAVEWLYKAVSHYDEWNKATADEVLEGLEQIGMQPPSIETPYWNRQDNEFHRVNEWEREEQVNYTQEKTLSTMKKFPFIVRMKNGEPDIPFTLMVVAWYLSVAIIGYKVFFGNL